MIAITFAAAMLACTAGEVRRAGPPVLPRAQATPSAASLTGRGGEAAPTAASLDSIARRIIDGELGRQQYATVPCVHRDSIGCGPVSIVTTFTPGSSTVRGDTARVVVRYAQIGTIVEFNGALRYVSQDSLTGAEVDTVTDTLSIVRDAREWRPSRADRSLPVAAGLALYYFDLPPADADHLASDAGLETRGPRPVITSPHRLAQLPARVRDSLAARGCGVLQELGKPATNVVSGAFLGPEGGDWAVLCVAHGKDIILVFPHTGGSPSELENIAGAVPDTSALRGFAGSDGVRDCAPSIFFVRAADLTREIRAGVATGQATMDQLTPAERTAPAHDGIGNGDCEGTANIYYWTGRRWIRLAGGD